MKNVIQLVSLELNDKSMVGDWKKMSDHITEELTNNADGFIYRDSAIGEDGKVYCILKWESQEKVDAFEKILQSDEFKENMVEFAKIANVETMKTETLKVF